MSVRSRLQTTLTRILAEAGASGELSDSTSLMRSGLVDSTGLVELAEFVEREVRNPLDLSTVNLEQDWDTMDDIVQFIERARSVR